MTDNTCESCIESVVSIDGMYCIRTMPIKVEPDGTCREWGRKGLDVEET